MNIRPNYPIQSGSVGAGYEEMVTGLNSNTSNLTNSSGAYGDQCDQLAANPNDLRHNTNINGVNYDLLRSHASEAVAACASAMEENPRELRYKYEYARALSVSEPAKAIGIFKQLSKENYLAAFDNLGNIYLLSQYSNYRQAAQYFIQGAKLGDPDSMISLVRMIDAGYVNVANPEGYKYALIRKAAALGHRAAAEQLQYYNNNYYGNFQNGWGNRQLEQQMLRSIFSGIIMGIGR